jgi:hypothetical protein
MNRANFLRTTAGLLSFALMPGVFKVFMPRQKDRKIQFKRVQNDNFLAPVYQLTPNDGNYQHTYFDVTPFSPSQRYLAVSKLPFEDRMPVVGDLAEICIIDTENETIRTVYATKSWGLQTGTNVSWGGTDRYIYANDIIDGAAVGVRIDIESGDIKAFCGPKYSVSPDDSCFVGFPLELFDATQYGYGCPAVKPYEFKTLPPGASKTEGIWRTDIATNKKTLIVSLWDAASILPEPPPYEEYTFYFWHSKFNKQGTRIYQVLRCIDSNVKIKGSKRKFARNPVNLTFRPDGSEICYTTPQYPTWGSGGGHPNWHPNGDYLVRHLKLDDGKDYFVQFKYDGSEFFKLSERIEGGGHPSIEAGGRFLITDSYSREGKNDFVHLRLIDLKADEEIEACKLPTRPRDYDFDDNVYRLDGHPCWSPNYDKVTIQAAGTNGSRQLFLVDMSEIVKNYDIH